MNPIGFVSAILNDLSFEEVADFAGGAGFDCVEAMCWPPGKATRRYAGVTHIDVDNMDEARAREINDLLADKGVTLSALGYYPNLLTEQEEDAAFFAEHLKKVIRASALLDVKLTNTFVGRNQRLCIEDNWDAFLKMWKPLVSFAEDCDVTIGIENCPMLFTLDEWPGGQNLAISPDVWGKMFDAIPSDHFGLNYDPSHLVWQYIDPVKAIRQFGDRIVHFHAKDLRIDREKLDAVGILGFGWNTPKLPGLGDVNWGRIFSALTDAGYRGPVCIEVEDRAYEGDLETRQLALTQTKRFLQKFC